MPAFGMRSLELGQLVRRIVDFAELLLNGLHLLIQVVLALATSPSAASRGRECASRFAARPSRLRSRRGCARGRLRTSWISSTFCFASSLSDICAATVSARRPGCSIPASDVRISGGTLRLSFHVLLELRDDRTCEHVHFAFVVLLLDRAASVDLGAEVLTSSSAFRSSRAPRLRRAPSPCRPAASAIGESWRPFRAGRDLAGRDHRRRPASARRAESAWCHASHDRARESISRDRRTMEWPACGYTTTSRSGSTGMVAAEVGASACGVSVLTRISCDRNRSFDRFGKNSHRKYGKAAPR